ncbi:MAG: DUF1573 domain-containing protein [Phycisphaerae bacterium]|jgi:hypothetical protein
MSLSRIRTCVGVLAAVSLVAFAVAQNPDVVRPTPPASQPSAGQAKIEISGTDFDFGEIWQGTPPEREFTVKNVGTAPLILNLRTTCGCTAASKPRTPLPPGETTSFTIRYDARRPGPASKKVIITTNDPEQSQVIIPVHGTVKAIVDAQPSDRIAMHRLDADSHETVTITLKSTVDKPMNLKVKEGQNFTPFDIQLKELEPGRKFELKATTVPPLRNGTNHINVVLETGLEEVPTLSIPVFASVQPRVSLTPSRVFMSSDSKAESRRTVRVMYKADTPVKVLEAKANHPGVTCEIRPPAPVAEGERFGQIQIMLTVPPYNAIPETGIRIEVTTDDADPQFQHLYVMVVKRQIPRRNRVPGATSRPTGDAARYPIPGMQPRNAQPRQTPQLPRTSQKPEPSDKPTPSDKPRTGDKPQSGDKP